MTLIDPYVVRARKGRVRRRCRVHPANNVRLMLAARWRRDAACGRLAACPPIEASVTFLQRIVPWLPGQYRPSPCVALAEDQAQT